MDRADPAPDGPTNGDPRREIPAVDALLSSAAFSGLLAERPRARVLAALRRTLDRLRDELARGARARAPGVAEVAERVRGDLARLERTSLRPVINATGVPLHTNLGRAPLAEPARAALDAVAAGYSNLEYELDQGARGSRHDHCTALLCELTGAEAALVMNNNAAAVLLALNELAEGGEVIVSRGELVEIGGSFRVPEIIAKSGARIVEVGATNRTHPRDYERAIGRDTRALLKVHRSNFTQAGFVSDVGIADLVTLAHDRDLPVVHDIGSGLLAPELGPPGLPHEPSARDSLAAGADLVSFSADKLLGGPQAGLLVGRAELVNRARRNPLLRALRVGKLTLAALEATLRLWRDGVAVPALAMLDGDPDRWRERAESLADRIRERAAGAEIRVSEDVAEVGGGSYPGAELRSWVLRVNAPDRSERELERALRAGEPPVIARVHGGVLCLDPRTVLPGQEDVFVEAVAAALRDGEG